MRIRPYLIAAAVTVVAGSAMAEDKPRAMQGMSMPEATNPASQAYLQAMDAMNKSMQGMIPTNDPSMDFVMMMKPHHQAAVDMAQAYLKAGKDPELLKMAKDIVASQEKEIKKMNEWEAKHKM